MRWELVGEFAVGGTTDVGFSSNSKFLLVASSQGRGVFDVSRCERVARDYEAPGNWHNGITVAGIGPLDGEEVLVHGFGNPTTSEVMEQLDGFDLEGHVTEFVAASISANEQYLVIGYSSDVQLYRRA